MQILRPMSLCNRQEKKQSKEDDVHVEEIRRNIYRDFTYDPSYVFLVLLYSKGSETIAQTSEEESATESTETENTENYGDVRKSPNRR